jgi:hypothetical protein
LPEGRPRGAPDPILRRLYGFASNFAWNAHGHRAHIGGQVERSLAVDRPLAQVEAAPTRRPPARPPQGALVRAIGLGLLAIAVAALSRLHALVTALPRHPPSLAEMLLSLVVVAAGMSGAPAFLIGPDLFQPHPWPPRPR